MELMRGLCGGDVRGVDVPFGGSGKNWRTTRPSPIHHHPPGAGYYFQKRPVTGEDRGEDRAAEACIKLVLIMILLVVCLMAIAGAFLINSVNRFYLNEFYTQMVEVFSEDTEFVRDLVTARERAGWGEAIDQILLAKMGPLGVDGKNRNYYILDGGTAEILASSDDDGAQTLEKLTPNLLIALNEKREEMRTSHRQLYGPGSAHPTGRAGLYHLYSGSAGHGAGAQQSAVPADH